MKTQFESIFFAALVTITLMGLSFSAHAKNPQSCRDGEIHLESGEFQKSIKKFNSCLRSSSLSRESRASALYNRAASHFFLYEVKMDEHKDKFDKINKHFTKAQADIDKSIELNPTGIPKAYCLRGWMMLDYTMGAYGYDELDKGLAMGAPKNLCDYSNYSSGW